MRIYRDVTFQTRSVIIRNGLYDTKGARSGYRIPMRANESNISISFPQNKRHLSCFAWRHFEKINGLKQSDQSWVEEYSIRSRVCGPHWQTKERGKKNKKPFLRRRPDIIRSFVMGLFAMVPGWVWPNVKRCTTKQQRVEYFIQIDDAKTCNIFISITLIGQFFQDDKQTTFSAI